MKNILLIITSCCLFIFVACNPKKHTIHDVVDSIYSNNSPYNNIELKADLYSKELNDLFVKTKNIEQKSISNIPKKEKPYIIEGEVFASLYEGWNTYEIRNVNINENRAIVNIRFTNNNFEEGIDWTDQIILVKDNTWKLDNVIYDKKQVNNTIKSLKNRLTHFIDNAK